jgi:hypothetical protein
MAAIIGDAHGGRQRINDTCTHGQQVRAPDSAAATRMAVLVEATS